MRAREKTSHRSALNLVFSSASHKPLRVEKEKARKREKERKRERARGRKRVREGVKREREVQKAG